MVSDLKEISSLKRKNMHSINKKGGQNSGLGEDSLSWCGKVPRVVSKWDQKVLCFHNWNYELVTLLNLTHCEYHHYNDFFFHLSSSVVIVLVCILFPDDISSYINVYYGLYVWLPPKLIGWNFKISRRWWAFGWCLEYEMEPSWMGFSGSQKRL